MAEPILDFGSELPEGSPHGVVIEDGIVAESEIASFFRSDRPADLTADDLQDSAVPGEGHHADEPRPPPLPRHAPKESQDFSDVFFVRCSPAGKPGRPDAGRLSQRCNFESRILGQGQVPGSTAVKQALIPGVPFEGGPVLGANGPKSDPVQGENAIRKSPKRGRDFPRLAKVCRGDKQRIVPGLHGGSAADRVLEIGENEKSEQEERVEGIFGTDE
jgi:hypothetical protein